MITISLGLVKVGCAELFFLLFKSREITVLFKTEKQRSSVEQRQIERGLWRSILLEMLVFVPASAILVFLIIRPFLQNHFQAIAHLSSEQEVALDGLLGVISYNFPFSLIRRVVSMIALKSLKDFAAITIEENKAPGKANDD